MLTIHFITSTNNSPRETPRNPFSFFTNDNTTKISCTAAIHVDSDDATNRDDGQSVHEHIEGSFDADWNFIGHWISADQYSIDSVLSPQATQKEFERR